MRTGLVLRGLDRAPPQRSFRGRTEGVESAGSMRRPGMQSVGEGGGGGRGADPAGDRVRQLRGRAARTPDAGSAIVARAAVRSRGSEERPGSNRSTSRASGPEARTTATAALPARCGRVRLKHGGRGSSRDEGRGWRWQHLIRIATQRHVGYWMLLAWCCREGINGGTSRSCESLSGVCRCTAGE